MRQAPNGQELPKISRREVAIGLVAFAATGLVFKNCGSDESIQQVNLDIEHQYFRDPTLTDNSTETDTTTTTEQEIVADTLSTPYNGEMANEIAGLYKIERSSYWQTSTQTMELIRDNSGWLDESDPLPVFPAALYDHTATFKEAAAEYGIPVNALLMIATIESAGLTDVVSGADAVGIMQVVPKWQRDNIDRAAQRLLGITPADDAERAQLLANPEVCIHAGAQALKDEHEGVLRTTNFDERSAVGWARSLAGYNGGRKQVSRKYEDMPTESQLYTVHGIRIIQDLTIASDLRSLGLSNQQIRNEMVSESLNADAWAYQNFDRSPYVDSIAGYEQMWAAMADIENADNPISRQFLQLRNEYLQNSSYKVPVTPALRLWLVHGGLDLFKRLPANMNPDNY